MIKTLIKIFTVLLLFLLTVILYLSFFGVNTKLLNNKIRSSILDINKKTRVELKNVKLLLDPFNLSVNIKTLGPEIFIDESKLELEFLKTNISLKSFINKEFSIDDLQISTKTIRINDIIYLARSFKNTPELFFLKNIIKEGYLVGDISLNFDKKGKIKNDYIIKGFIKNGKLEILRKYSINNLNLEFNIKDKNYFLKDVDVDFNKIKLSSSSIKIEKVNNQFLIGGKLKNKNESIDIKMLSDLLGNDLQKYNIESINFNSDNNFNFALSNKLKISNINLESQINLNQFVYKNNLLNIKKYLPNFKELINIEDNKILISYKKNQINIDGKGKIIIENKADIIEYKININKDKYIFNTNISIEKNPLLITALGYKKKEGSNAFLKLNGIYKKDNIKFNLISFEENDNRFLIKNLRLNNKFKIIDINRLELDYANNKNIRNQIKIKKDKQGYRITGKKLDVTKMIDEISSNDKEDDNESNFSNLTSDISVKIDKVHLSKDTYVNNLIGNINFKDNKIYKLNLESVYPNNKKLNLTINTNQKREKITTLYSGYPKPLIRPYKFIKGFEEGVLDFYSITKDGVSNSILNIDNFKIKEVPIFAKLLSLASLQGIADLLTGEGIRFTDFEMKFSNKKNLTTIDEMYAIGPAVSILMDGYIESEKLISLRGTLVPATTINRTIASIPLLGNILVGKKTGEGIFGVSFKIKGPPKKLKTSVNPIKTLTPRFITRTLEKIKKN